MKVITFGTFDLFHIGHLRLLERAAGLGDQLVVGISSDQLNFRKKGKWPTFSQQDRMDIVAALGCVDGVFSEESLQLKRHYILQHRADILVMGDDWEGRFDDLRDICDVRYLPRTEGISTTQIRSTLSHTHAA